MFLALVLNWLYQKNIGQNKHNNKRIKETETLVTRNKVNDELGKIQEFILNSFNTTDANIVDKKWLENQIHLYYNPPAAPTTSNRFNKLFR